MKTTGRPDHPTMAEALRRRIMEGPGRTTVTLRQAVAASATGGAPAPAPYEALARQIGDAACRVTDSQVAGARAAAGSETAAFELVMAAAVGAGLLRWDHALKAVREARDAPA